MLSPFSLSQSLESGHIETLPGAEEELLDLKREIIERKISKSEFVGQSYNIWQKLWRKLFDIKNK